MNSKIKRNGKYSYLCPCPLRLKIRRRKQKTFAWKMCRLTECGILHAGISLPKPYDFLVFHSNVRKGNRDTMPTEWYLKMKKKNNHSLPLATASYSGTATMSTCIFKFCKRNEVYVRSIHFVVTFLRLQLDFVRSFSICRCRLYQNRVLNIIAICLISLSNVRSYIDISIYREAQTQQTQHISKRISWIIYSNKESERERESYRKSITINHSEMRAIKNSSYLSHKV